MRKLDISTLVLAGTGFGVIAVCCLAVLTSRVESLPRDNQFQVRIEEKERIRSASSAQPNPTYSCRASAEECALAAVQEMCGSDEYEITFGNVRRSDDGRLDGEWGYRCFKRVSAL